EAAARYGLLPLAHLPAAGPPRLLLEVSPEAAVAAGDRLVVCGPPREVARLLGHADDAPLGALWAGWLRRYGRAAARTLAEIDRAVLICTIVLLTVVTSSTLVFHYAAGDRWATALSHTVGVIATAGALPTEVDVPAMKVFVS